MKEGENALIPCLLTDPAATDVRLRMKNGSALPSNMNVTFDPKKGMLIRDLKPWFSSEYVCSARIGGEEKKSSAFNLKVTDSKCLCSILLRMFKTVTEITKKVTVYIYVFVNTQAIISYMDRSATKF